MAAKAMSQTLVIIVAAVVILVTALVLLTLLGGGLTPVANINQAQAQCQAAGESACSLTGSTPPTWASKIYKVGDGEAFSCQQICGTGCPVTCGTQII